jgi:YebC/PmpR family DNA-binding regulatory protein
MAGHSHSKNIARRKGAADAVKGRVFNKLAREIMVAAKLGMPDPAFNPRLRSAIAAARVQNLPRERIERAISNSQANDAATYDTIRYEGYGPGGVALIVETLTDNRNRTASNVRTAFSKYGGAMGEMNSVSFMFAHVGVVAYPATVDFDALFETAVEAGADDVVTDEDVHEVLTSMESFIGVREALEEKFGQPQTAAMIWRPHNTVEPSAEQAETLLKLIDVLEEDDDVQAVFGNYEISDALAETLGL